MGPPPMRLLVVGQRGTDRSKLVARLADAMGATVVSLKDDFVFKQKMREFDAIREERAAIAAARDPDDGENDVEEDAEPFVNPAPETYVFPILERLLHADKTLSSGCVVDGDPSIFTPEVIQGMIARRMHPSAVLHATIDNTLASSRRLPEE